MSREVCGICWCPYDEDTKECACVPEPNALLPHRPLTDEEALDIARTFGAQPWPPGSCVAFARAVERAHGIGGEA